MNFIYGVHWRRLLVFSVWGRAKEYWDKAVRQATGQHWNDRQTTNFFSLTMSQILHGTHSGLQRNRHVLLKCNWQLLYPSSPQMQQRSLRRISQSSQMKPLFPVNQNSGPLSTYFPHLPRTGYGLKVCTLLNWGLWDLPGRKWNNITWHIDFQKENRISKLGSTQGEHRRLDFQRSQQCSERNSLKVKLTYANI